MTSFVPEHGKQCLCHIFNGITNLISFNRKMDFLKVKQIIILKSFISALHVLTLPNVFGPEVHPVYLPALCLAYPGILRVSKGSTLLKMQWYRALLREK